jgi:hypothetical protein
VWRQACGRHCVYTRLAAGVGGALVKRCCTSRCRWQPSGDDRGCVLVAIACVGEVGTRLVVAMARLQHSALSSVKGLLSLQPHVQSTTRSGARAGVVSTEIEIDRRGGRRSKRAKVPNLRLLSRLHDDRVAHLWHQVPYRILPPPQHIYTRNASCDAQVFSHPSLHAQGACFAALDAAVLASPLLAALS